jgi:hypothetical protein
VTGKGGNRRDCLAEQYSGAGVEIGAAIVSLGVV